VGLFFISIDYDELTEDSLLDDFVSDFSGLEDDFLEDLV